MTAELRALLAGSRALDVAPRLLGATLRVAPRAGETGEPVAVRLTEVEAYEGERDPGSHAFRGRTARTASMFEEGGRLYVYFTYGMHWCCNVVCGPAGTASAVLLRGGEVVEGLATARERRRVARDVDLARGPARLAQALGLDGRDDGELIGGRVRLTLAPTAPAAQRQGPRVGVRGPGGDAARFPWRFWLPDEPTVSAYRPGTVRRRAGRPAAGERRAAR